MKGLLKKDMNLLGGQKYYIICLAVISVLLVFSARNTAYVGSYVTVLGSFLVLATISYDEMNRGFSFLFTMPVTRQMYVTSKYLLGALVSIAGWTYSLIITGGALAVGRLQMDVREWMWSCLMYLGIGLLFDAVMIPIQIRFGTEKGRIILLLVTMLCLFLGMGLSNLLQQMNVDLQGPVSFLTSLSPAELTVGFWILVAVLTALSYGLSVRMMKRKEF